MSDHPIKNGPCQVTEAANIEVLVKELITEVRGLRADLAKPAPTAARLRPEDRDLLGLLPHIAQSYAPALVFTVRDLWLHAREDADLRRELEAVFGQLDEQSARRAGLIFRRLAGRCGDGYRIVSTGIQISPVMGI